MSEGETEKPIIHDKEKRIAEMLAEFDFVKISQMMEAVGWKWMGKDVTPGMLLSSAQKYLEALGEPMASGGFVRCTGSGGLVAILHEYEGKNYMELRWGACLAECESENGEIMFQ